MDTRLSNSRLAAQTQPLPTVTHSHVGSSTRIETVCITTGEQAWQAQRVISAALRRRRECLALGDGVCAVVDAREMFAEVEVDLLVPIPAERCDHIRPGVTLREVHRLVMPIVDSLCALHDAGLAHGGIEITNIRRRVDGRGVLVGFDPEARLEHDVAQMAGLILDWIPTGSIDGRLAALLTRAVDADRRRQPTMSDIAEGLSRGHHDSPVRPRPGGVSPPARRRTTAGAQEPSANLPSPPMTGVDRITRLREYSAGRPPRRSPRQSKRPSLHRHARSVSPIAAIPWPWVAALLGSSALTWMASSLLR